nr:galactose ABC transporter substrate-binding protein [Clostridium chromiireducens]
MKIVNKIMFIIIIFVIIPKPNNNCTNLCISSNAATRKSVNVGVLVSDITDPYISQIKQDLENIQKDNANKVNFTFFDAKGNQATQNETLDTLLKNNIDLFLVNLVDTNTHTIDNYIDSVKQKGIPLILFNSEPLTKTNQMIGYKKFAIITTNPKEAGNLQGKLISDIWNKYKSTIDKNGDDIIQYIMLQGELDNIGAIERTNSSISAIKNAGVKTQQLALQICNWNQELAKNAVESLLLKLGNRIELIISNNDAMAIGALEALQKHGYNMVDKSKYIPIFGVDGIPSAQDLIIKGFMTGTVVEDPNDTAVALYTVGMNLVNNKSPLEDTPYKFDETGFIIRIPYRGTFPKS